VSIPDQISKYRILGEMGRGLIGTYLQARDERLGRDVTLKVLRPEEADDRERTARFQREAQILGMLMHESIASVLDFDLAEGGPYMAIEALKGKRLSEVGRDGLGLGELLLVTARVLEGLAHAHQHGVVNRNVNPTTVWVTADGAPKIFDFSVARVTSGSMLGTGKIVGTPDYMSPEQVKGLKVDGRSDIFSVGCMLYEMLTSRRPFHDDNVMAVFYKVTHEEPDYDRIPVHPGIQHIVPILEKALEKSLASRYQTAVAMAGDIRRLLPAI
jgi:serine/threonine-protein kinase